MMELNINHAIITNDSLFNSKIASLLRKECLQSYKKTIS